MYLAPSNDNRRDPEVQEVQRMLNSIRVNFHHCWDYLSEDGIYGIKTANVVRQFQIYRGISSQMVDYCPILGDTTIAAIREYYRKVPIITNASISSQPIQNKKPGIGDISKTSFELMTFLTGEGMPFYKMIQDAFPIAFKKISPNAAAPFFVFSKSEAYHNPFGAKYSRIDIPDSVSRYLGNTCLIWSLLGLKGEIEDYYYYTKINGFDNWRSAELGANVFSLSISSLDFLVSSSKLKKWMPKLFSRYAVAELGSAVSLRGVAALSTIGQIIGAFLLGWEIGKLIGSIPIGNGKCVQDLVNKFMDYAWDHPFRALGLSPIAFAIDSWKKLIVARVNMISNVKPLTPEEKRKLKELALRDRELQMYAAPPKLIITAK